MAKAKVSCLNPNSGSTINIDKDLYDIFHAAITNSLASGESISFTEMVNRSKLYLQKNKTVFSGSISWYVVMVKNDMQSREQLDVFMKQGKKLHKLRMQS